MNIFNYIIDFQQDSVYQKNSILLTIYEYNNKSKQLYLPYFIIKLIDFSYVNDEYNIVLPNEVSYYGFLEFLNDFINNRINVEIDYKKQLDMEKFFCSIYLGKTKFYNIRDNYNNHFDFVEILINKYDNNVFNKYIQYVLINSKSLTLYNLKDKYNEIPDYLLQDVTFLHDVIMKNKNKFKIDILSKFKDIVLLDKYTKYQYEIIKESLNKYKIIKYKDMDKEVSYHETFDRYIIFDDGYIRFEGIIENLIFLQDNIDYQKLSTKVIFKKDDEEDKYFYIPDSILKNLDESYYNALKSNKYLTSDFEYILTENETFKSFMSYLEDYFDCFNCFNGSTIVIGNFDKITIQKYIISKRFTHDFYDIYINNFSQENIKKNVDLILENTNESLLIQQELLVKILDHFDHEDIFKIYGLYQQLDEIIYEKHIILNDYIDYKIDDLLKFKNIYINIISGYKNKQIKKFKINIKIEKIEDIKKYVLIFNNWTIYHEYFDNAYLKFDNNLPIIYKKQ